jgi:uncharacterized membrane protein (DUF485 family)
MTTAQGDDAAQEDDGAPGSTRQADIDWLAAERSPEFRELIARKRAFVLPATVFFLAWYFGFVLLAGYAPDFMGREFLADGLTVGYVLALTQFIMVWGLVWAYVRRADRVFDPLAEKAGQRALEGGRAVAEARSEGGREPAPTGKVVPQ